jgi:hypothetical protein
MNVLQNLNECMQKYHIQSTSTIIAFTENWNLPQKMKFLCTNKCLGDYHQQWDESETLEARQVFAAQHHIVLAWYQANIVCNILLCKTKKTWRLLTAKSEQQLTKEYLLILLFIHILWYDTLCSELNRLPQIFIKLNNYLPNNGIIQFSINSFH